jgi:hypothetical protein
MGPGRGPWLAGGFLFAALSTFDRSLPIPLDGIPSSLHRPLRGTPRIAQGPRHGKRSPVPGVPRIRLPDPDVRMNRFSFDFPGVSGRFTRI